MQIARAMSNQYAGLICCLLAVMVFCVSPVGLVKAQTAPPPVVGVQVSPEGMVTVTDIILDKTDKNAVLARDQAIVDAQRLAFQTLVQRSMPEERFKSYLLPDDKTISTLVQDFEIKNEQISSNRYVANFTVRFSPGIAEYIESAGGVLGDMRTPSKVLWSTDKASSSAVPSAALSVLVLPYFKNNLGKNVLWEDLNPWREAWQKFENSDSRPGLTVSVPTGDISDISFGSSDAVWAGDYSALDKLKEFYKADVVALAVAYSSDTDIRVDVYYYRDGRLDRKKSLAPYNLPEGQGGDSAASFQGVIPQVVNELWSLKSRPSSVETGLEDIESSLKVVSQQQAPSLPTEHLAFDATMVFNSFSQWIEAQKRLSSISPSLQLNISSLSKDTAWFTVTADLAGGMEGFKAALALKGLGMESSVDPSSPGRILYTIRMN